ncbi:hypothetical protein [Moritella viscosa]|uniref:Uncharacterized protein n=1 Tax=Moritella viscosa TaxID=80854 RepID=A0ABY1HNC6_9GAMM|nr:hypothetical protein [Moritella viscosa]SGZ03369.1 Putative uncharacterized protein [Moritella viscosa]
MTFLTCFYTDQLRVFTFMLNPLDIAEFIPELKTLFQTLSFNLFAFAAA